jgi:GTP pyrophosphokinase
VVIGPTARPVEIQIRTEDMHRVAEEGIAAHWKYKGIKSEGKFDQKVSWMKQVNEWQRGSKDAQEFLSMLHIDFFEDEMFCFTPRGRVIELPKNATVLDFAFAVHSGLGMQCVAAKVNGHFVPLRWKLKNGDLIDIIRSKTQRPSRDWLKLVITSKAKTKIKQYIRSTQNIPVKSYNKEAEIKKELEAWIIDVDNMTKPEIRLSKCCKPLPGEKIIGYATKAEKVSIHKTGCPYIKKYKAGSRRRKVNVRWMDNINSVVEVKLDADERTGLFAEVLNTLITLNMPIKHAHAKPLSQNLVECSFNMEINSIPQLQDVITRVKKIQGVRNVFIGSMSK